MPKRQLTVAENEALGLIAKHGIAVPPVPIERIARLEGARIQFGPLDNELSGMAFVKDGVGIIGVNALHHPNRQRFTMAHELGHLILHRQKIEGGVHVDKELTILRRDGLAATGTDKIEIEANQFAGQLLVPDSLLDVVVQNRRLLADDGEIDALARRFKVSAVMMQFRLQRWLENL
jgi:Zn-dependent peptidase ImmA (M78 family)